MSRITPAALQGPSPGLEALPPTIIEGICHNLMPTHKGPMQPNETSYTKYKLAAMSGRKYAGSVRIQRLFHEPRADEARQDAPALCKQAPMGVTVKSDPYYEDLEQHVRMVDEKMIYIRYNDDAEHMPRDRINHLGNFARTCKLFSDHARSVARNHTFELSISPYGVAFEGYRDGVLGDMGPTKLEEHDIWWTQGLGELPFLPSRDAIQWGVGIPRGTVPGNLAFGKFVQMLPVIRRLSIKLDVSERTRRFGDQCKARFYAEQICHCLVMFPDPHFRKIEVGVNLHFGHPILNQTKEPGKQDADRAAATCRYMAMKLSQLKERCDCRPESEGFLQRPLEIEWTTKFTCAPSYSLEAGKLEKALTLREHVTKFSEVFKRETAGVLTTGRTFTRVSWIQDDLCEENVGAQNRKYDQVTG